MRFRVGDIILLSAPFGAALYTSFVDKACASCLTCKFELRKCSRCETVNYCSERCQENDALNHEVECESLRRSQPWTPDAEVRLLCRIWARVRREASCPCSERVFSRTRTFDSLLAHREHRSAEFIAKIVTEIGGQVERFLLEPDRPSSEMLVTIFLKMSINTHQVSSWDGPMGCALYLGASIVDHSCVPDCRITYYFDAGNFVMKAIDDVELSSPDELHISYVSFILPRESRREQLKERYFFDCCCSRCVGRLEVVSHRGDDRLVGRIEALRQMSDCQTKYAKLIEIANSDQFRKLATNDYSRLSLNAALFAVCGTLARYDEAALIGHRILDAYAQMSVAPVHTLYLLCQVFSAALNAGWYTTQSKRNDKFVALLLQAQRRSELLWGAGHYHSQLLLKLKSAFVQ